MADTASSLILLWTLLVAAGASPSNRMIAMGGTPGGSSLSRAVFSSTDGGATWSQLTTADMLNNRIFFCAGVRQRDGRVFIFGGRESLDTSGAWMNHIDVLNTLAASPAWARARTFNGDQSGQPGGVNNEGCAGVVIGGACAGAELSPSPTARRELLLDRWRQP
jgi:hypothetical protein